MKIVIASDHAGFTYKNKLVSFLEQKGYTIKDIGCYTEESCDYPIICEALVKYIQQKEANLGILLCGSGIGVSMCANRYQNIRAANCSNSISAELARQHNNANVLCIGARLLTYEEAKDIIKAFLSTEFKNEERYKIRIEQFNYKGEV